MFTTVKMTKVTNYVYEKDGKVAKVVEEVTESRDSDQEPEPTSATKSLEEGWTKTEERLRDAKERLTKTEKFTNEFSKGLDKLWESIEKFWDDPKENK